MDPIWIGYGIGSVIPLIIARTLDGRTPTAVAGLYIVIGMLLTVPALVVEQQLQALVRGWGGNSNLVPILRAFLVYGLVEEILRFLALSYLLEHRKFADLRSALAASVWLSIGFAVLENAAYVSSVGSENAIALAVVRVMLPTAMHVCCGVLVTSWVVKDFGAAYRWAFPGAVALHGVYDYFALRKPPALGLMMLALVAGVVVAGLIVRRGRMLDAHARRGGGE